MNVSNSEVFTMKIVCSACGHVGEIKKIDRTKPTMTYVCKKCGTTRELAVGVSDHRRSFSHGDTGVMHRTEFTKNEATAKQPRVPGDTAKSSRRTIVRRFIIITIAVITVIFLVMAVGMFFLITHSDAYRVASDFLRSSDDIRKVVGDSVTLGGIPTGYVETSNGDGRAEIIVKVKGDMGSTHVRLYLVREAGDWRVVGGTYEDDTGTERIFYRNP